MSSNLLVVKAEQNACNKPLFLDVMSEIEIRLESDTQSIVHLCCNKIVIDSTGR